MARIRTIKPDAFLSESLSEVSRGARWTFAGLWTYADDEGRARDEIRLIKAALYPLDDSVTLADVEDDVAVLTKIGGVCRYLVEGRRYLHMPKWHEHQRINRPTASKLPKCPDHEGGVSGHVIDPEDSLSDHGGLTEDSPWEGKGREGKGRDSCASADAERDSDLVANDFNAWYETYPRKRGRGQALKAYRVARKKVDADVLLARLRQQIPALTAKGPEFVPYPATWLNGERWDDEPDNIHHLRPADDQGRILLPPPPKKFFEQ